MNRDARSRAEARVSNGQAALELRDLHVTYGSGRQRSEIVRDFSLRVEPGAVTGLVGESGCGKSTVALAIARYLPRGVRIESGSIHFGTQDLLSMRPRELRSFRAHSLSFVSQDPGRALNPLLTVGAQLREVFENVGHDRTAARAEALTWLDAVRIADPVRVMSQLPHQLSGGMLQRAVIAMALAVNPSLLILDEPTTALDATVEAEILYLVAELGAQLGTSVLLISHDLNVVRRVCDDVSVMYAGRIVESGPVAEVLRRPAHPYTEALLRSVPVGTGTKRDLKLTPIPGMPPVAGAAGHDCAFAPRCAMAISRCVTDDPELVHLDGGRSTRCFRHAEMGVRSATKLAGHDTAALAAAVAPGEVEVRVSGLSKTFGGPDGRPVRALVDVSFEVRRNEILGVVGESGSGKTTLARMLVGLTPPDPGSIIEFAHGRRERGSGRAARRLLAAQVQFVFQNPATALNRRQSVRQIIGRPMRVISRLRDPERARRVGEVIRAVRLDEAHLTLRPTELSGGQQQRVALARALATSPRVLVLDEPTSALDVSVQASILNLVAAIQDAEEFGCVLISHDLDVIRYLADRILVLYRGHVVEYGPASAVLAGPNHPYTERLLSAGGSREPRIAVRAGAPATAAAEGAAPSGCVYSSQCHRILADGRCETIEPPLQEVLPGAFVRCHLSARELAAVAPPPRTP